MRRSIPTPCCSGGMSTATPETAAGTPPIVALVASAGGIQALQRVLSSLRPDLQAAVIVLLHLQPARTSVLTTILSRATTLTVVDAVEGETVQPGTVYVALPDAHLQINSDGM